MDENDDDNQIGELDDTGPRFDGSTPNPSPNPQPRARTKDPELQTSKSGCIDKAKL